MDTVPTETPTPLLELKNLSVSYLTRAGEVPAVVDFSLTLRPGESVGLVGESGCGKSTVAMAIMRYLGRNGKITGGSIHFKGCDLATLTKKELQHVRGREIAMVYQEPMTALNPSLTIGRQLAEVPMVQDGLDASAARARVMEGLADVHLPDPERIYSSYPHQLSGGQVQRALISMALLGRPSLLLLDEPTTALDVTIEAGIVNLIREISARTGTSLLYISHNLGLIHDTCDRVSVMYSGEVVEQAPSAQLFEVPRHPYTIGLFQCMPTLDADKASRPLKPIPGQLPQPNERPTGCNFAPRCSFAETETCEANAPLLAGADELEAGHQVRCFKWQDIDSELEPAIAAARITTKQTSDAPPILSVEDLDKSYAIYDRSLGALFSREGTKYIRANEGLTFGVERGKTLAVVGESGCGKSTFAKVLMGLETATGGKIIFKGEDVSRSPVRRRRPEQLASMQMVFQDPSKTLNPSHTIGRQIARVVQRLDGDRTRKNISGRVEQLLDLVNIPREMATRRPRQLSGGQKQRIGIARAFAGNPELVVADEPVSALDVSVQAAVTELLIEIQRERGTTYIFVSHDLGVVRYLADQVVVLYLGRIMEAGTTKQVFEAPHHPYTEALLSAVPDIGSKADRERIVLPGSPPSALNPPGGCPFHTRCPRKIGSICETERPAEQIGPGGHRIACHITVNDLSASQLPDPTPS